MIDYLEIIDKIKDVDEKALDDFNNKVSIPLALSNIESTIKQDDKDIIIEYNNIQTRIDYETRKSYYEIIAILRKVNSELFNKIDFKYVDFFEKFKIKESEIDLENGLEGANISLLTLKILAMLNIKFWCELDSEKKKFLELMEKKPKQSNENNDIKEEIINLEKKNEDFGNLELMKNTWWTNLLNKIRNFKNKRK